MEKETKTIKRKNMAISTEVERTLKDYLGIAQYSNVSILYCRECNRVIGEIPTDDSREGWFNPGRTCECGRILPMIEKAIKHLSTNGDASIVWPRGRHCPVPDRDPNIGALVGPETARNLLTLLGFA